MNVADTIEKKLRAYFNNIEVLEIINESPHHNVPDNSETHFRLLIVSKDFEGLGTVKRHQKVYEVLATELKGPIHAFSQKTFTPSEWRKVMGAFRPPSPPCQHKP